MYLAFILVGIFASCMGGLLALVLQYTVLEAALVYWAVGSLAMICSVLRGRSVAMALAKRS